MFRARLISFLPLSTEMPGAGAEMPRLTRARPSIVVG